MFWTLSMTSRIVYCPSTLLFLFLTFPLRSIKGVSKKVNFQTYISLNILKCNFHAVPYCSFLYFSSFQEKQISFSYFDLMSIPVITPSVQRDLRAGAHHRHVVPFCVTGSSKEFPVTQKSTSHPDKRCSPPLNDFISFMA